MNLDNCIGGLGIFIALISLFVSVITLAGWKSTQKREYLKQALLNMLYIKIELDKINENGIYVLSKQRHSDDEIQNDCIEKLEKISRIIDTNLRDYCVNRMILLNTFGVNIPSHMSEEKPPQDYLWGLLRTAHGRKNPLESAENLTEKVRNKEALNLVDKNIKVLSQKICRNPLFDFF